MRMIRTNRSVGFRGSLFSSQRFGVILSCPSSLSFAADRYPTKPITLIIPYQAGGGTDLNGRLIAKPCRRFWGKTSLWKTTAGIRPVKEWPRRPAQAGWIYLLMHIPSSMWLTYYKIPVSSPVRV